MTPCDMELRIWKKSKKVNQYQSTDPIINLLQDHNSTIKTLHPKKKE